MGIGSYINQKFDSLKASWLLEQIAAMPRRDDVGVVTDKFELESACRLLYKEYRRRKYCLPSDLRLHYNRHMFAKDSRTFVIGSAPRVLGTLSVFPDSTAGLPLEELYSEQICQFRREGMRLAEVGLLATDLTNVSGYSLSSPEKMQIVFSLFKVMVNYALSKGVTHLVIVVNPKHCRLYRFLGFSIFGEIKTYPGACGAPALPMILELAHFQTRRATRRWFLENVYSGAIYHRQLTKDPDAFAELFGDSFHDFNDRYNRPDNSSSKRRVSDAGTDADSVTARLTTSDLRD